MKGKTHLYILGVCFAKKGKYFVKIGTSKDIKGRIADLQTGCPEKIRPLAACEMPSIGAIKKERALHAILAKYKSHGEWFLLEDESYMLMAYYFLELLKDEDNHAMVRFKQRPYKKGFDIFPDQNDYINEPKIKINNLTGKPQLYQKKRPEFALFSGAIGFNEQTGVLYV